MDVLAAFQVHVNRRQLAKKLEQVLSQQLELGNAEIKKALDRSVFQAAPACKSISGFGAVIVKAASPAMSQRRTLESTSTATSDFWNRITAMLDVLDGASFKVFHSILFVRGTHIF